MTANELRTRASERRRVGWEISDAMTPDEMESLAKQLDQASQMIGDATASMGQVIAAEREACAKIADALGDGPDDNEAGAALYIAEKIRKRGQ